LAILNAAFAKMLAAEWCENIWKNSKFAVLVNKSRLLNTPLVPTGLFCIAPAQKPSGGTNGFKSTLIGIA